VYTGFWWGNLRERDRLEHLGGGEMIILKLIFHEMRLEGVEWSSSG
jgi:hypothetical protein